MTSGESSTQPSPSHFMNSTALVLQKSQDQQHCSKKPQDQSLEGDRVRSSFLIKTKTSTLLVTMIFKCEVEEVIKAKRFSNAWPDRQDFPCSSPAFPAGPSRGWQKKFNQLELSTEGTTSATSPSYSCRCHPRQSHTTLGWLQSYLDPGEQGSSPTCPCSLHQGTPKYFILSPALCSGQHIWWGRRWHLQRSALAAPV